MRRGEEVAVVAVVHGDKRVFDITSSYNKGLFVLRLAFILEALNRRNMN